MKIHNVLATLATLALSATSVSGAAECIDAAPPTVYEDPMLSPQNIVSFPSEMKIGFVVPLSIRF